MGFMERLHTKLNTRIDEELENFNALREKNPEHFTEGSKLAKVNSKLSNFIEKADRGNREE